MTSVWFFRRADLGSLPAGPLGRLHRGQIFADQVAQGPEMALRKLRDLKKVKLRVVVALLDRQRCVGFVVKEAGQVQCFSPGIADLEYLEGAVMRVLEEVA